MADAPELNFGQMLQSDPAYLEMQQRQMLAESLMKNMQAGMPGPGASFHRSPIAALADFMAMKGQREKLQGITAEERALLQHHKDAEATGMSELTSGLQTGGDPRMAIVKAMSSQYPRLKQLGDSLFKANQTNFGEVVKGISNKLDPQSVIDAAGGGGYAGSLRTAPPLGKPEVVGGVDPNTRLPVPFVQAPRADGSWQVNMPSNGSSTILNNQAQPATQTLEQQGKFYAEGGEGWKMGNQLRTQLRGSVDTLGMLENNPSMGAGAEAFQTARKWAETFSPGISQGLSGNADQLKAQLYSKMIQELGGLGHQVSDKDAAIMKQAVGSLDTDPNALRRMVTIGMKYQMLSIANLDEGRKRLQESPDFKDRGVQFPPQMFNVPVPGSPAPGQQWSPGLGFAQEEAQFPSGTNPQTNRYGPPVLTPPATSRIRKVN